MGDSIITVVDYIDWKVGDQVLITGTEGNIESYE